MNNTAAMWLVLMALTFIMRFVRKNKAAKYKVKFRFLIVPLHLLYLSMLLLGLNKNFGAYCAEDTYPHIFIYQYGIFFLTYLIYRYFHHKNYFIEWDAKALAPGTISTEELATSTLIDEETRVRTQARLIFM